MDESAGNVSSDINLTEHSKNLGGGADRNNSTAEAPLEPMQFKRPVLLTGPKKGAHKYSKIKVNDIEKKDDSHDNDKLKSSLKSPAEVLQDSNAPLPYKEPKWSTTPDRTYTLEVLKSGTIVETYDLKGSFFVFGRSTASNCILAHPSISRYHSVLQYGKRDGDSTPGFYLYDLNSTHGSYFNKYKIKPNLFVRLHVGHMIKLGLSSRIFLLQGPPDDVEPESEMTVTEMKNQKLKEKLAEQFAKTQLDQVKEDEGIDWGMGEDADEEADLSENPFAVAPNEELYIDDPKKTLRGWFEREGAELEYDCQEKGFGQFVCRVELPVDNARGQSIVAEAVVKGKKKEAVVQCALEACRILDQHGLLRQSNHESRKKKAKDWEADDFYDSDDDTFLDRTGTVEKKRQKRMQEAGVAQVVLTHPGLLAEHSRLVEEVTRVQVALSAATNPAPNTADTADDELDRYMAGLVTDVVDKGKVSALKVELARLKQDENRVRTLANIARPAGTPELLCPWPSDSIPATSNPARQAPMIGKRRTPAKKPATPKKAPVATSQTQDEDKEEFDSD